MINITAVVVTYKRRFLLERCLLSLVNQSYRLHEIIIIDNNSNDGTSEMIVDFINTYSSAPPIYYKDLLINGGGSFGFYSGIELAISKRNSNAIWLLDDDVELDVNCLKTMVDFYYRTEEKYKILLPNRFSNFDKGIAWTFGLQLNFTNPFYSVAHGKKGSLDKSSNDYLEISGLTFEGPLIFNEVFLKIGNVEKDYFINLDDIEFGYRCLLSGYKIVVVRDAYLFRLISNIHVANASRIWNFKDYYLLRNTILLDKKYKSRAFALLRAVFLLMRMTMSALKSDLKNLNCYSFSFLRNGFGIIKRYI